MAGTVSTFSLPKGMAFIKFIRTQRGSIMNEKHVAYGGLLENSGIVLPARKLSNGNFANVLSNEEKAGLERMMGLEEDALSVYKTVNNFWKDVEIRLTKEGFYLNLEDPNDFIKVKVLTSYPDLVARSLSEYNKDPKATQKFVIVWPDEENITFNKTMNVQMEAYKQFGKIEDNEEAMKDLLTMYGVRIAEGSSKEWIKGQVGQRVQENPKEFLGIITDPQYKLKILLKKGVSAGVIKLNGGLYQTTDGLNISFANTVPNLTNALAFLGSNDGQDMRIRLESEIEKI